MNPGTIISQYEILSQLGGGGMGVVYKTRDTKLDRFVALKFLPPEFSRDDDANARFMQEARAASSLDHPNICTIYDIRETENGRLYIVMAYYEGQTLKYRLNDGPLSAEDATDIARQIASGLEAAHKADIVHRDIKPANIMVTDEGRVKILDFGIAKLAGGMDLTKTGGTVGTAYYMSPEQIRGEQVDHRTDLWALGVVMYQMLTGRRPFEGEYEQAVSYAILNQEPAQLPPDVPETLSDLTGKLLEKDPAERCQSASEVLRNLGVSDPGLVSAPAIPRGFGSRPWLMVGIPAFLVVATLLLVGIIRVTGSGGEEAGVPKPALSNNTIAVMPFSVGGAEELSYLSESMVDLLSVGLQGAGDLQTIDPNSVFGFMGEERGAVRDPQRGREVASHFGAGRFVLGNVTKLGSQIRINASLYGSDPQPLQQAEARASNEEDLASMVDKLVVQLITEQVADPLKGYVPLAAKTTKSFPALKAYLRGELAYREGRLEDGNEALREAFEVDTTFALAMYRITDWGFTREQFQRLKRHRDKLPERERMLFEAEIKPVDSFKEKISFFQEVTNRYPTFSLAWFRLGDFVFHNAYSHGVLTSASRQYLERALALDPNNGEVLFHLIDLATYDRDFDTVDSLLALHPDQTVEQRDINIMISRILSAAWREDERALDTLLTRWPKTPTGWTRLLALNAIKYLENVPFALSMLDLLRDGPSESERFLFKILAETARGRFRTADSLTLRFIEQSGPAPPWWRPVDAEVGVTVGALSSSCLECPPRREFMLAVREAIARADTTSSPGANRGEERPEIKAYLSALMDFRLDDHASFLSSWEALQEIAARKGDGSLAASMSKVLEGLSLWRDGDLTGAIEATERHHRGHNFWHDRISPFYNHTLDRYLRAELLFAEGRYREALPWFASLIEVEEEFMSIPYQGPSLLRRAEIYEQLGDKEKAVDFYRRFIKLWESADAEVQPLVDQARRRLDDLIEQQVREPAKRAASNE